MKQFLNSGLTSPSMVIAKMLLCANLFPSNIVFSEVEKGTTMRSMVMDNLCCLGEFSAQFYTFFGQNVYCCNFCAFWGAIILLLGKFALFFSLFLFFVWTLNDNLHIFSFNKFWPKLGFCQKKMYFFPFVCLFFTVTTYFKYYNIDLKHKQKPMEHKIILIVSNNL